MVVASFVVDSPAAEPEEREIRFVAVLQVLQVLRCPVASLIVKID
jgi:hypothetical protein